MPKGENSIKIEAGQIINPENFPVPNELVCIQTAKVFDQVAVRDCITTSPFALTETNPQSANINFEGVTEFDITGITVLQKTDSMTRQNFKKLRLSINTRAIVNYSYTQAGCVKKGCEVICPSFNVVVNEIYCPDCITQIGVVHYPHPSNFADVDGSFIKVEAIFDAFYPVVTAPAPGCNDYKMTLEIGAFFVIKCECIVQLLIPAYGYCPVPPEQHYNPVSQTCTTFNDRRITPFPTQFFPDQKWNPLDKTKKEDWDD